MIARIICAFRGHIWSPPSGNTNIRWRYCTRCDMQQCSVFDKPWFYSGYGKPTPAQLTQFGQASTVSWQDPKP